METLSCLRKHTGGNKKQEGMKTEEENKTLIFRSFYCLHIKLTKSYKCNNRIKLKFIKLFMSPQLMNII